MNNNSYNLFGVLYGCFNQYAFSFAKANVDHLRYFYQSNAATCGNQMVEMFLDAIEKYNLEDIAAPMFRSILSRTCGTEAEANAVFEEIVKCKGLTQTQIEPLIKELGQISSCAILNRGQSLYKDDPVALLRYLKGQNVPTESSNCLKLTKANEIDINSIIANSDHSVIKSSMQFINEAYPLGGYFRNQIVCICMPPGQGKSLFMEQELLYFASQGEKVWLISAGDLNEVDLITRLCAIYHGVPLKEAAQPNVMVRLWKNLLNDIGENLHISVVPAGTITAEEIVDHIVHDPLYKEITCLGIDYDGTLKPSGAGGKNDNMYLTYGQIYEEFTKITVDISLRKLVLIAAQPGKGSWNNQIITMADIGESAKKMHNSDMIITAGREQDSNNTVRQMYIAKNRRGETEVKAYTARLNSGKTVEIPKAVFDSLSDPNTPRMVLTQGEIDRMIGSYNNNVSQINQRQQQQGGFGTFGKGASPFGN